MAQRNKATVTLAAAASAFNYINEPDSKGRYADNKYKTNLKYDDLDDLMAVKERVTEGGKAKLVAANLEEICHRLALEEWGDDFDLEELRVPWRLAEDQTKEYYEGLNTIAAKTKYAPALFDSQRNKLKKGVKIYSGDVISIIVDLLPYESTEKVREGKKMVTVTTYGISAQLKAVQLVEKVAGGGASADGFEEYDDGFANDDYDAPDEDQNDEDDHDDDDDGDY